MSMFEHDNSINYQMTPRIPTRRRETYNASLASRATGRVYPSVLYKTWIHARFFLFINALKINQCYIHLNKRYSIRPKPIATELPSPRRGPHVLFVLCSMTSCISINRGIRQGYVICHVLFLYLRVLNNNAPVVCVIVNAYVKAESLKSLYIEHIILEFRKHTAIAIK